jgi:hypothetical protein
MGPSATQVVYPPPLDSKKNQFFHSVAVILTVTLQRSAEQLTLPQAGRAQLIPRFASLDHEAGWLPLDSQSDIHTIFHVETRYVTLQSINHSFTTLSE